ncbi:MAG TPA: hydroxyacid dehydrogenase [Armatimonadetes bacterium]|nr:hydroxyacid dehydrogenase [Armatimonadota bacterium]
MPDNKIVPGEPGGEFLLYESDDGAARVEVRLADETVWLTQKLMAELFDRGIPTINEHLSNIYEEGELDPGPTIRKYRIVQTEGGRQVQRLVDHYSLDAIIAVGYRVRSHRGTQFRRWATALLKEYVVKGFVLDDERLKDGGTLGRDYFDELLERIRDIRASERRFYQKITDIYATSIDYDPRHPTTHEFFATVQNKLHWAVHGHTAAEVIAERADATRPHMGLTSWRNAPSGKVRRHDVSIAKNYLTEDELRALNRIVTQYLDYAEDQAERRRPMRMADWRERLDAFLTFNEREVLEDTGRVSHEVAKRLAETELNAYEAECRRIEATEPSSDFDRFLEEAKGLGAGGDANEAE